jgi:FkbM family methyltransferase
MSLIDKEKIEAERQAHSRKILDQFIQNNPLGNVSRLASKKENFIQGQENVKQRIKIINNLIKNKIEHLDIGARNGIQSSTVPFSEILSLTLVEPDPIEAKKLRGSGYRVIEQILSDVHGVQKKLYFARKRGVSSLFKPNINVIMYYSPKNHTVDKNRFDTQEEVEINSTTISKVGEKLNINFDDIKIDTEGSELKILKGLGVQRPFFIKTEVEMVELFHNQALFHEVLAFLYDLGYIMCDLDVHSRINGLYYDLPTPTTGNFCRGIPFSADAYFIADWMRPSGQDIIARNSKKWASTLVMRGYADIVEIVCSNQDIEEGNEIRRILRL